VAALGDADAWVKYYASRAIAERRHAAAVPALERLAASDPAPHVRIAALNAIGALGASSAVATVKALTGDPHADVAAAALAALGLLAAEEGLPDLQDALRAPDPLRRAAAIGALTALGTAGAVSALEWAALADDTDAVGDAAVDGLESVASRDGDAGAAAVDVLCRMLADTGRRERAMTALARLPSSRLEEVARGLQHPSADVRSAVVDVLGRVQRADATALLAGALADDDASVRETAVAALTRLGTRGLEPRFAALAAQDPAKRVRRAAAAALASLRSWPA
jgi:HEAT repeat protein